ncbi:MAG TPA: stage II sporulation protein D [Firmicutes bacterium]|nr:stage II sporulation protein D [Bacillota bacterium]
MLRLWIVSLLITVAALFSPLLFLPAESPDGEPPSAQESAAPLPEPEADADMSFTVLGPDGTFTATMDSYLPCSVAAEMPASFEPEALKAQAVAIRSYIMNLCSAVNPKHPEASVCTDPGCCKGWLSEDELRANWGDDYEANMTKIVSAVRATDGEYLAYDGEAIQAVFHASSAGATEDSAGVWSDVPYLVSVSSPETADTVPSLVTEVRYSPDELSSRLLSARPDADVSGEPGSWLGETERTASGRVAAVTICSERFSGTEARGAFGLRSTDFDVAWSGSEFIFTVRGYGHGVGMSQEGANLLAGSGMSYSEILAHYYPGTELVRA